MIRALSFSSPHSAAVIDVEPPTPGPNEALIAPSYIGLCGTDSELLSGEMPYFEMGEASYPLQPGHEVVGVVTFSPPGHPAPGSVVVIDPVFGCGSCRACEAGFATRCGERRELGVRRGAPGGACELIAVPASNMHAVPAGIAPREAVLVEPGVTALNAVEHLGEVEGRRAAVIGAGTLGLLAAQLLVSRGADVDVVAIESTRGKLVERLGARPVEQASPNAYAAVVEAAGRAEAMRSALTAVEPGGYVAVTGVQPHPVDELDVNEIVLKDATVQGILNGPGLYDAMLDELSRGTVDAAALIDAEFELADADAALAALATPNRTAPKILLRIDSP